MGSNRFFRREFVAASLSIGALLVVGLQGLLPVVASADTEVTANSATLSTTAADATGVSYAFTFTPTTTEASGAVVLDFCDNSPVIGSACDTAGSGMTGFSLASAEIGGSAVTPTTADTGAITTIYKAEALTSGTPITVTVTGVHNPGVTSSANDGGLYVRLATYANPTDAEAYTATTPADVDFGEFAMNIVPSINVSAAVPESMIFCVASLTITQDCANAAANAPDIALGTLSINTLTSKPLYTQMSTNAPGGAVVDLKSDQSCGGLQIGGSGPCGIAASGSTPLAAGISSIGVETTTGFLTSGDAGANGVLTPAGSYSNSSYLMGYDSDNSVGVTSQYGDPLISTGGAPSDNANMEVDFGASISPTTPPGTYAGDYEMIATGTF